MPANSRIEVAAGGTVQNPAKATAVDLVDGEVATVADKTGPFGVGTHTIIWTASDLSGNTASTTQTLVVTLQATGGDTSTGGSSGGGSLGLWLLLLLLAGQHLSRPRR